MSNGSATSADVAVIGGGPAGIAGAVTAAESERDVVLIDDNAKPGGQIWRRSIENQSSQHAAFWFERLAKSRVRVVSGSRVIHAERGELQVETDDSISRLRFEKLILATGARELFLPFPGWTLPNVVGAGGLQALVKSGLDVAKKRVVVAGTGPLLFAVAAYLCAHGAEVVCICEQAPMSTLTNFAGTMLRFPAKISEAVKLRLASRKASYLTNAWPVAAIGGERLESVRISDNGRLREIPCDYLACGFHLVPNTELAQLLGCQLSDEFVATDDYQQTSMGKVYCAGEPTGIGGMELSILEGRIAGHAATNKKDEASRLFTERARYRKLALAMEKTFRLRHELKELASEDTLVCRCEDVTLGRVRKHTSWKAAKLHTRCGMGPCQGRVCGAAARFLFGWNVAASRPPVFPARCSSLAEVSSQVHGGSQ
ncbi:MAG TPA: FAD/NAD(P)-binding oxidoreductase [Candidatus Acidoferrum sp.]|nr:FAD/NAD(P)-binding oxidoreductase [Candidatus Acidoferrum sp.]